MPKILDQLIKAFFMGLLFFLLMTDLKINLFYLEKIICLYLAFLK